MSATPTTDPAAGNLAAAHIYDLLQGDRQNPEQPLGRRCHKRIPWITHITVSTAQDADDDSGAHDAMTYDFSASGIGLVWHQPIEPGTVLTVWFEALPRRPGLTATVRHCAKVGGTYYHVGAEFIGDDRGACPPGEHPSDT